MERAGRPGFSAKPRRPIPGLEIWTTI